MSIVSDTFTWIGNFAISTISFLGYGGIVVLMALESMVVPLPSELVMPFAGFIAAQGTLNIWLVILFSGIGSLIGSLISYYIGMYGGNAFVVRFGKYVFFHEEDLKTAEDWFAKRGEITIFVTRFVPVVRHVISIPAGIAKMNIVKFCIYTFVGATIWNAILAYVGYYLGEQWEVASQYVSTASHILAPFIVIFLIVYIIRHVRHARRTRQMGGAHP